MKYSYHELETKVFDFFINDELLLNLIGISDELHYNYLLKQIYNKTLNSSIALYTEGFPIPSDINAIQTVQYALLNMNLNQLNNEDIVLTNNPIINKKVKEAILMVLQPRLLQPFKSQNVKQNFFTKQIVWLYEILNQYQNSFDDKKVLIYYGTASEDDCYLLQMLYILGFKILYINSFKEEKFGVGETIKLDEIAPMKPFKERLNKAIDILPEESISNQLNSQNKITTWAGEAKEELYNSLYDENSIIRPWQFKKWTTKSINFNAVIEDINTYWKEDGKLRPGFKAENGIVSISNFMTKINGCYSDLTKYNDLIEQLISPDLVLFIKEPNFLNLNYTKQEMFSLGFIFENNRIIEEQLTNHPLYKLNKVNSDIQHFIITKLNEFMDINEKYLDLKDFVELIATVITIDESFLRLIENFDYPFKVPKVVIYLYNRESFDKRTGNFINFLNLIGLDIVILSPTGSESMEDYMYGDTLNTIQLEEMRFNLTYEEVSKHKKIIKKKGFFSNLFS